MGVDMAIVIRFLVMMYKLVPINMSQVHIITKIVVVDTMIGMPFIFFLRNIKRKLNILFLLILIYIFRKHK